MSTVTQPRIFVEINDLCRMFKKGRKWAAKELNLIRVKFKLESHQPVSVYHLIIYYKTPEDFFLPFLK